MSVTLVEFVSLSVCVDGGVDVSRVQCLCVPMCVMVYT